MKPKNTQGLNKTTTEKLHKDEDVYGVRQSTSENELVDLLWENNEDMSFFIEQYKKENDISLLLNQEYYWEDDGWFNLQTWLNNFYIQWDIVFANNTWNSKIFKIDEDKLVDLGKKYREIKKVWDYYVWINIATKDQWDDLEKIDWSETYVLLNDQGNEIKKLHGGLRFDTESQIYVEYVKSEKDTKNNFYDKDFRIIAQNLPNHTSLLWGDNWKYLFFDGDNQKYFILAKWADRKDRQENEQPVEQSTLFLKYQKTKDDKRKKREEQAESLNVMPLEFSMEFEGDTHFIKSITDKHWNSIFKAEDWVQYKIDTPSDLYGSDFNSNKNKTAINKWLFILSEIKDDKKVADTFINARGDKPIVLNFSDYAGYTFLRWKVIKHFIDSHNAELYDIDWKKLWMVSKHLNNESIFHMISTHNNKNNLVENKTWKIKWKEFDRILKTYNKWDKKIVVVENNWKILAIEIQI